MIYSKVRKTKDMTIHALLAGQPLCEFNSNFPKDWPSGNTWTSVDDIKNINCEKCLEKAISLNNKGSVAFIQNPREPVMNDLHNQKM
jgi:hypothetical protein